MGRWVWFVLGFVLVLAVGGAMLLGCLPGGPAGASDAPTPSPTAVPSPEPTLPSARTSLVWQREAASGCVALRVDDLSQLYAAPCGEAGSLTHFTQQELHAYLAYVARYAPFTYREEPTAANDMATVLVEFVGRGTQQATPAEQAELAVWAGQVHARVAGQVEREVLVTTARTMLAERLSVAPEVITTVSVEMVTWPDACLGIADPARVCAQVLTPGYRITLRMGTDTYTYHTDLHGLVRLGISQATPPAPTATPPATARPTALPTNTLPPTAVPTATRTPTATPVPTWTPAPAPTDSWRAEYFANEALKGVPAVVAYEDSPNHTWGYSGPAGIPADYFSARWRRRVYFEEGKYDFRLEADDGVRLWVGGMLIIDRWAGGLRVDTVSQKGLPAGEHEVVLEYFELEGYAKVDLGWQKVYIEPTPAPEPLITDWRGEYYNNTELQGRPSLITNETRLDFDWGEGSPNPIINRDRFSARYTRRLTFPRGDYRLIAYVDDGVRVWVDGRLVIDAWQTGIRRAYTADVRLDGAHDLRVDYLEVGGAAALSFAWEPLGAPAPATPAPTNTLPPTSTPPTATPTATATATPANAWHGEYYGNMNLQGSPLLTREEAQLAFEWGEGSPGPQIPSDRFSARFTRRIRLAPGTYRIGLVVDDGGRVYVDGKLVIDEWRTGTRRHVVTDLPLGGQHELRVEYFENAGAAALYFGLEALPAPTPQQNVPRPSATPTRTPDPASLWRGEYYDNAELASQPEFVRTEADLAFDWREGSPDPRLEADTFSARFTRLVALPKGVYRLHLVVDDGARVYVDGTLVIDEWRSDIRRHVIHDLPLDGQHTFLVEYFENKGDAALFFAWEGLSGTAARQGAASDNLSVTLQAARAAESIYMRNRNAP